MKKYDLSDREKIRLIYAYNRGYDEGFIAITCKALRELKQLDLIEQHPNAKGIHATWRITEKGQNYVREHLRSK